MGRLVGFMNGGWFGRKFDVNWIGKMFTLRCLNGGMVAGIFE